MRVLIADDDCVHVRMVSNFLNQRGIDTTPVYDCMQTLMFARRTSPELIILDINMPGGNGFDVLKKLKASNITGLIPVVVLSGSIDHEAEGNVLKCGAVAFVRKSADMGKLYEVICRAVRIHHEPSPKCACRPGKPTGEEEHCDLNGDGNAQAGAHSSQEENGMKILVAEDDSVTRRLLRISLERWNYEVIAVDDGTQARDALLREGAPKLAILDWVMPGADGIEICRELRKREAGSYIYTLLLTSKGEKDDLLQGLEAGADDYLVKPFDPLELQARLRRGCRVIDMQNQLIAAREAMRDQATHDALRRV